MNDKDGEAWAKMQREGQYECYPSKHMPCNPKRCEMFKWCILDAKIEKVQFT